jgi:raffinose/stachyose/melibiose transport system permease protein
MADTTAPRQNQANYVRGGGLTALIFLPPALTLFTVFVILPIGEAGWYGFYNWNGLAAL